MSETPANRDRTRRRVVRRAGPPVEGDGAIEVKETSVAAVSPKPVEDVQPIAVAEATSVAPVEPAATESAAPVEVAAETESAEAEPEFVVAAVEDSAAAESAGVQAADAAAESESEGAESKSRVRRIYAALGRSGSIAAAVALISTLVLIGSGGLFFYHQNRSDALSERRAEYVQVAKQAYIDMVTVKSDTAGPDLDRLFAVAGGGLKDDLAVNRDDYKKVFEQMKVQSSGKIISAALESDDANSAKVLLLAQQTVSNAASNGPMQKDYRFRVTVNHTGGAVTATGWELVP